MLGSSGCGESLLHSLFLCLNAFSSVKTDRKDEKGEMPNDGSIKKSSR